jgi:hypothetical protein
MARTSSGSQDIINIKDSEHTPETVWENTLFPNTQTVGHKRLIIAVDFGTTFSSVSYVAIEENEQSEFLNLDRIHSIEHYPNDLNISNGDRMRKQVPTEVIYPINKKFRRELRANPPAEAPNQTFPDSSENLNGQNEDVQQDSEDNMLVDETHDEVDEAVFSDETKSFQWGYGVHEASRYPGTHSDEHKKPLGRFKLLLDASPLTDKIRNDLTPTLESLKTNRIINDKLDVITDFLTCLLRHTKSELKLKGYNDEYGIEMVMCVPAIWSERACRQMQRSMSLAVGRAGFSNLRTENNSIENLFIVSEPEAAAAYTLAANRDIRVRRLQYASPQTVS